MINIKVKMPQTADVIANIRKNLVTEEFAYEVQKEVVDKVIKPLAASGTSPVDNYEGSRRLRRYKNPKVYPAKKKPRTPANLWLTGIMLSFYKAARITSRTLRLGIPSGAPEDIKSRAEGNNIGTVTKRGAEAIPPRRFIPLRGEVFRTSVMRALKRVYAGRIASILSTK